MKYIDGFRSPGAARYLTARIRELGDTLAKQGRAVRIMEVCGTHTMAIARHGIRTVLPNGVSLLSGPGCPVCVTDAGYVDAAIELATRGVIIATFGDMVRVPGSARTLAHARSEGARVEVCYSPNEALTLARKNPDHEVVFLAIGFETTMAPVTALLRSAYQGEIKNLSLLTAFKLVPPALSALIADPEVAVDAFICPAHVSAIIGSEAYRPFVEEHGVPSVVAGFEPLDILFAISELLDQISKASPALSNQYDRVVRPGGNTVAQRLMKAYLREADASWRGIGVIPKSGLVIRDEYARFDAAIRHGVNTQGGRPQPGCRCGDVLKGKLTPADCPMFGKACTPSHPVGPCMVSSEGSCAAYHKYVR